MKEYSFSEVDILINGVEVTELGEGDDVFIAERINDAITHVTGAKGNMVVNISPDQSGTVTIKVLQTSPTNNQLETHVQSAQNGSFSPLSLIMRDSKLNDIVTGNAGFCANLAPVTRGNGVNENEWVLTFEKLNTLHGSTTVSNIGAVLGA